jgi:hypothetical protein
MIQTWQGQNQQDRGRSSGCDRIPTPAETYIEHGTRQEGPNSRKDHHGCDRGNRCFRYTDITMMPPYVSKTLFAMPTIGEHVD